MALEKQGSFDQKQRDKTLERGKQEKQPQQGTRPQPDQSKTTK